MSRSWVVLNGKKMLHRLDLDDHRIANEQIHPKSAAERDTLVFDVEIFLDGLCERDVAHLQFVTLRVCIGRLEQAGWPRIR